MVEFAVASDNLFLQDVVAMRSQARAYLDDRDIPAGRAQASVALLQSALTIEILCVWRYTMMSVSARGLRDQQVGFEFQEQANDERKHTRMVAERISELGGVPDFQPAGLESRFALDHGGDFDNMVAQNLAAEQSVVEYYSDLIRYFGPNDPRTTEMLRTILQDEEDHATDMQDLLAS